MQFHNKLVMINNNEVILYGGHIGEVLLYVRPGKVVTIKVSMIQLNW